MEPIPGYQEVNKPPSEKPGPKEIEAKVEKAIRISNEHVANFSKIKDENSDDSKMPSKVQKAVDASNENINIANEDKSNKSNEKGENSKEENVITSTGGGVKNGGEGKPSDEKENNSKEDKTNLKVEDKRKSSKEEQSTSTRPSENAQQINNIEPQNGCLCNGQAETQNPTSCNCGPNEKQNLSNAENSKIINSVRPQNSPACTEECSGHTEKENSKNTASPCDCNSKNSEKSGALMNSDGCPEYCPQSCSDQTCGQSENCHDVCGQKEKKAKSHTGCIQVRRFIAIL